MRSTGSRGAGWRALTTGRAAAIAALAFAVVGAAGVWSAPAESATSPRLSVSPSSGVPRAGTTVQISGSGYATTGNGIYVAWCRGVPQYWKSADNCSDARWVHRGGAGAGQVELSGSGGFTAQLTVRPTIEGHSCLTVGACAVLTMAAHGSSDRSQDAFAPVTFAPAPAAPPTSRSAPTSSSSSATTGARTPRSATAPPVKAGGAAASRLSASVAPATRSAGAQTQTGSPTASGIMADTAVGTASASARIASADAPVTAEPAAKSHSSGGTSAAAWSGLAAAIVVAFVAVGLLTRRRLR